MKKIKRIITIFCLMLLIVLFTGNKKTNLQADNINDERELKAVWMSTYIGEAPYSSETQFKSLMNEAFMMFEYYGINALIFHVRTHNNAFYKSELNPKVSWWSSANFDLFDPIGWLIEESHKRGIEFHAWMNPYRVSTTYQTGILPSKNPQSNPNNLIVEGDSVILNPALPVVKEHIYNTIIEFAELYPTVDAIHFDDYFYINTSAEPKGATERRAHIDSLIEGINDVLRDFNETNNKAIQFGISPTGIYKNGNGYVSYDSSGHPITTGSETRGFEHYGEYLYADTVKWAINEWIDYLLPQTYWARNHSVASYTKLIDWWDKVFKNLDVNLYSGIGVYMADAGVSDGWNSNMYEMDEQLTMLKAKEHVKGYSIYSFKHLESGYNDKSAKAAQQIKNAYQTAERRSIKVLPEIKTMTPVIPFKPINVVHLDKTLSWDSDNDAKFHYIYRSSGELSYSSDEIIGVVGNGITSFVTDDSTNNYNYGVRVLSRTNHLSPISLTPPAEVYDITYNLDGGSFSNALYSTREEMIVDFLTDFYNFVEPTEDLNTFMHGVGKTSGFDGLYDETGPYFEQLYKVDNKGVDPSTGKFINQEEYNKWVPLLDLIDEYTNKGYPIQDFWGSVWTGARRIKPFFRQENLWEEEGEPKASIITEIVNRIPKFSENEDVIYYEYTKNYPDIILPVPAKEGFEFLGWYTSFTGGSRVTVIPKGSTGDISLFARWKMKSEAEVTLYFDLGYNDLWLDSITIDKGSKLEEVYSPTRAGYQFLGWLKEGSLFNFDESINSNVTFVAYWKRDSSLNEHFINFNLGYNNLTLETVIVESGNAVNAPIKPLREGYLFSGWYDGLIRFDFTKKIYRDYDLVAKWNKKTTLQNKVETIDGASIRTTIEQGVQRLRFYGKVDSSLINDEFGFYAVFGDVTPEYLLDQIRNSDGSTMYINGRDVKKQAINKADYNNEFSIVLTGIPKVGYADKLTVIAYAKDKEGNLYLAETGTTRSVLEVAVKMEEAFAVIDESTAIINYAKENMYKLDYDVYGNLKISKGLFEEHNKHIKEVFFNDWNREFGTNFINPTASDFFSSAKTGSSEADRNSRNILKTNLYKFFNDATYKTRWGWFLDYLQAVDYTIHVTGQVEAIKGNGTYRNPDLSQNKNNLYNGNHLVYSIYNFFNETSETGGYTAINFASTEKHHDDNMNKYDRYEKVKEHNNVIYIDVGTHNVFKLGDTIRLPEINLVPSSGKRYVYFDGTNYYSELSLYTFTKVLTFEIQEVSIDVYPVKFYDGNIELLELKDYYLTTEEKKLPILTKDGFIFIGWYLNKQLTGNLITKINLGSTGDKEFYVKWEKEQSQVNIVYDFGEHGYHTTTKAELFVDFWKDYQEFFNISNVIGGTIHDFYHNSELTLPNKIEELFLDPVMGEKWGWLEDYLLIQANLTNYLYLGELESYNQEVWRLNIQAFFTDVLYKSNLSEYQSMNFSNLVLGNSFWKYTIYNTFTANYTYADSLITSDAVKSWDPNYEFVGWVNLNNEIINNIDELEEGNHHLRAFFKEK